MTFSTVISKNTKFIGSVVLNEPMLIEGIFDGEIESSSYVEIAESASYNGNLKCETLLVKGKAEGNLTCMECLTIEETGCVKGDITSKNLVTNEGAILDGTIKVIK